MIASVARLTQRRLVVDVGAVLASRIASLVITTLTTVLVARSLGANGQGVVAVAWLVPTLLSVPAGVGANVACTYLVGSGRSTAEEAARASSALVVVGTSVAVALVAVLALVGVLPTLLPNVGTGLLVVALVALPFLLWRANLGGICAGSQRVRIAGAVDSALPVLMGVTGAVAVVAWAGSETAVVVGWTFAAIAAAALALRWSKLHWSALVPRWRSPSRSPMVRYGLPAALSNGTQLVAYRLDLLMVNALVGASPAGVYAIATRMSELLWILPGAAGFVVLSRASVGGDSVRTTTLRVFWATGTLGLAASLVLVGGGWILFRAVLPSFHGALAPLLILAPGTVVLGAANVLANDLAGRGHPWRNAIAAGITATVAVVLDIVLIPGHGPVGAATASTVAYATCAVVLLGIYARVTSTSMADVARAWRWWRADVAV